MTGRWNLVAITYNVNKQRCQANSLIAFLNSEPDVAKAHIVCVGLQELPHAEVFGATPSKDQWADHFCAYFSKEGLVLMTSTYLASNQLLVYGRAEILPLVARVDHRFHKATLCGAAGYKGSIGIRLVYKDSTSMAFVTSHLTHAESTYKRRLQEIHASSHCTFAEDAEEASKHVTFWVGDLNFRLEGAGSATELIEKLETMSEAELIKLSQSKDQLKKAMRLGEAFDDWHEPPLTFKPTYRILVNDGNYDARRIPAWCDRVLYKGDGIEPKRYFSTPELTLSDHFPVSAVFSLSATPKATATTNRWSCEFEHVPTWAPNIPFVCRFSFHDNFWKRHGSYRDWIGVFPAELTSLQSPVQWIYLLTCYDDNSDSTRQLCVAEFPQLATGRYRVGYFSYYKNCIHGLSEPFEVNFDSA
ncbi:Endonuclease/Exonuclease/phosphatase family protein [Aphelenchoides avenae]|nr:Endonuclease/Exonuclease/phosphatase family protein [Aphelenchus avenae]